MTEREIEIRTDGYSHGRADAEDVLIPALKRL